MLWITRVLFLLLGIVLPGSGVAWNGTPRPAQPAPDIAAISTRYLAITQTFDARWTEIAAELQGQRTLGATRSVYAEAVAAEHELDGELVHLPLFPTSLKGDWKNLLMANRQLEVLYKEASLVRGLTELQGLEEAMQSARAAQLAADDALRRDLLLPPAAAPGSF